MYQVSLSGRAAIITGGTKGIGKASAQRLAMAGLAGLTIVSRNPNEALFAELEITRERGWAIDNEEAEEGLTCFALPLIDRSGAAVAAISCSGPATRMTRRMEANLAVLRAAAKSVPL